MEIKLVVVTAKGKFEHQFAKNYISIGRSKDNDLIIDDLSVSRRHAILEMDETGKIFISDLNSSNGTYVNNVKVTQKTPVTSNDHILLGKTTLLIESMEESPEGTIRVDTSQLQEKMKGLYETQKANNLPVSDEQPVTQPLPPKPQPEIQQTPPPPPPQPQPQSQPQSYTTPNPIPPTPKEEAYRGNIVYGDIVPRFIALLIDGVIIGIGLTIVISILAAIFIKLLSPSIAIALTIFLDFLGIIAGVMYYTLGYSKYGTTIGKKIMKLYVVDQQKLTKPTFSQALIRTLVQFFLSGIFFIGYILAFTNDEKKTLHDMLAKTYVIRK